MSEQNDQLTAAAKGLQEFLAREGLTDITVTLGQGFSENNHRFDDKARDQIQFDFKGPSLEDGGREALAKIRAALKKVPGLAEHVEFDKPEEHLVQLAADLKFFKDKGAKIPEEYLKWRGFNPEVNKGSGYYSDMPSHAFDNINVNSTGASLYYRVPESTEEKKKETALTGSLADQVSKDIEADVPGIKVELADRLIKYFGVKGNTVEEDKIKLQVSNLLIKADGNSITIRTPEQQAEFDRVKDPKAEKATPEQEKKFLEGNILSRLTQGQLEKALPRAIFHGGEHAHQRLAMAGGREDIARAVTRELKILKYSAAGQQDKDLQDKVDKFLADDTFKNHDWESRAKLKDQLKLSKLADPEKKGLVTTTIDLPENTAGKILAALAATTPAAGVAATTEAAPAAPTVPVVADQAADAALANQVVNETGAVAASVAATPQGIAAAMSNASAVGVGAIQGPGKQPPAMAAALAAAGTGAALTPP